MQVITVKSWRGSDVVETRMLTSNGSRENSWHIKNIPTPFHSKFTLFPRRKRKMGWSGGATTALGVADRKQRGVSLATVSPLPIRRAALQARDDPVGALSTIGTVVSTYEQA